MPLRKHLRRQRHVADLGHAGVALGAAVLQHQHAGFIDIEGLVVDAGVEVFDVLEHHRAAGVLHQRRRGGARLDDGAARREVALQHRDAGLVLERRGHALDHVGIPVLRVADVLGHGLAVGGDGAAVQQRQDLLHHHRQATGVAEVFHQVLAARLQIHQARQLAGQAVEVFDRQLQAEAAGDGDQVDHGIRAAADRSQRLDRVLERLARQDARQLLVFVNHVDDAPPGFARDDVAAAIDRGIGRVARQADAERLDHARHRARGAHRHAVAVAAVHAAFGLEELGELQGAGAHLLAHAPDAGARAQLLVAPAAVQHRPATHADGRQIGARRAHQQDRRRLVAAHQQHHAVDRVAADALLDVHRREVAVEHRRRPQQRLAERHHRKLEREAARLVDADLHLLGQRAEMRVARRQFAEGIADADHRPAVELVVRHAFALDPRAVGKTISVLAAEPLLAAQLVGRLFLGRRVAVAHDRVLMTLGWLKASTERTGLPHDRGQQLGGFVGRGLLARAADVGPRRAAEVQADRPVLGLAAVICAGGGRCRSTGWRRRWPAPCRRRARCAPCRRRDLAVVAAEDDAQRLLHDDGEPEAREQQRLHGADAALPETHGDGHGGIVSAHRPHPVNQCANRR